MPHSGWSRGSFQRLYDYESGQEWRHGAAVEGGRPVIGYRETLIRKGCWGNLNEILRTGNDPTDCVYCKIMS